MILLTFSLIQAQNNTVNHKDKEYNKFKTTLHKETNNSDTIKPDRRVLHPAKLPYWLGNFPVSDNPVSYALGISDPGMIREKAFRLAEFRAKNMVALMTHPVISSITDNFANEKSDVRTDDFTTKYENLYKIESSITGSTEAFEIVDSCFTSFSEAIVLVKYDLSSIGPDNAEKISISVDAYQVERQKQNKFETEERLEMKGSLIALSDTNSIITFLYSCHSFNNLFEINSRFNQDEIQIPTYYFRYATDNDSINYGFANNGSEKLSYGLWKAYSEQIIQKIILLSQPFASNVRQVGDQYTSVNQKLTREISEARPSFKLNKIDIYNNYLAVDIDYLNKPK